MIVDGRNPVPSWPAAVALVCGVLGVAVPMFGIFFGPIACLCGGVTMLMPPSTRRERLQAGAGLVLGAVATWLAFHLAAGGD